jgi:hypothetical protein
MWNYFIEQPYAKRESNANVLKYQTLDLLLNSQNLTGVVNKRILQDKGWETKNASYYSRIYEADKAGKQEKANAMINYLQLARGTKQEDINEALRGITKKDSSLTSQEKLNKQKQFGLKNANSYISNEYKEGRATRQEAETMYRKENPEADKKKVAEAFDRIDYQKSGKLDDGEYYSSYLPLYDAIEANSQTEIRKAIQKMVSYGYKKENIKSQLGTKYKKQYIAANAAERGKLQNRLIKAYNEVGVSSAEAMEIMQKWVLDASKSSK